MTIQTDSMLYRALIDLQLLKVGIFSESPEDRLPIPGLHSAEFLSGYIYGLIEEVFKSNMSKSTAENVMEETQAGFTHYFNNNPNLLNNIKPYLTVSSSNINLPEFEHVRVFRHGLQKSKEDFDAYTKDRAISPMSLANGLLIHMNISDNNR